MQHTEAGARRSASSHSLARRDRNAVRRVVHDSIAALRASGDLRRDGCDALEEKLAANTFNLVVVGQFKRGKTSVVNALIGEELLPVGVVPLTSIVTLLSHGERLAIAVRYEDGRTEAIGRERLGEFVTENGNPRNGRAVREVAIAHPSPWLGAGVRLVDTPGTGSVYLHNSDVAQRFLPKADAVLFLLSAEQPASRAELDYLKEVASHAGKIFVLVNKADLMDTSELRESLDFARGAVSDALGRPVELFPVSARLALQARAGGTEELLRRSGIPVLSDALKAFLGREKDDVLLASVARNVLRLVSQARFERELELKALSAPLEDLRDKLARFEARKQELLAARDEHVILVNGEQKKLLHDVVEKDLEVFEAVLVRAVATHVERQFEESRALPSRKLQEALHRRAVEEIRRQFDLWRAAEDDRVSNAFEAVCRRVAAKLDAAVDELLRFAADLFAVSYEAIRAETLWAEQGGFRYKFWEEPGSLHMLASSAILALPKFIGDRIVLRRAREAAVETARAQSGRVRYDFQRRLEKSARAFGARMSSNVETVLRGLEEALREGAGRKRAGEAEASRRRRTIGESLNRLAQARTQLEGAVYELQPVTA